ncbi:hypothetical protein GTA08_BOTSDO13332 [Botryosphaeria dothidea]|uniref:Uncharacterized protein n=1 Tax=Botryosphaeria dothidea TaxID=55169 RepID=A0A8H4J3S8_9PEZI|nr:hypothetical protein GTA08_BOTSDO13332 [Botryosphaeria dothidea]
MASSTSSPRNNPPAADPPATNTEGAKTPTPSTRIRGSIVAHLDTSTPAINASPVEIDGTPTSPDKVMLRKGSWGNNKAGRGSFGGGPEKQQPQRQGSSPDHLAREVEVLEEFGLIEGGENRTALLKSRKSDPAVLVDIPQGPSVEDFAAAGLLSPDVEDKKVEPAR